MTYYYPKHKKGHAFAWVASILLVVFVIFLFVAFENHNVSNPPPSTPPTTPPQISSIDYTQAPNFVGQIENVKGEVISVTSRSGATFLDYCENYITCPFYAIIQQSNVGNFGDLSSYQGHILILNGTISEYYRGRPQMLITSPSQIIQVQ